MANSAGITNTFKRDVMNGVHNFGGSDVYKFALYETTATISPGTATYTTTGELANGVNGVAGYTAGGNACTLQAAQLTGTTGHFTPNGDVSWSNVTFTTDCALLYNDTDATDRTVASFTFTSQTVSSGTFTLQMPVNDDSTGLVRIA